MKNKTHNTYQILNYFASTDRYKIILILTIILCLYGSFALGLNVTFSSSVLSTFMFDIFNIFMFLILFINTLNICTTFDSEFSFYIIRLNNKKRYIKELLKNVLIFNILHLIIFFLIYFTIKCFMTYEPGSYTLYQNYNITNNLYLIFYLGRYIILSLLFCIIESLIYINFKTKIVCIFNSLFIMGFLLSSSSDIINNKFLIFPWNYFNNIKYNSFSMEVLYSCIYILILVIISLLLYKFILKKKETINNIRYIFFTDILYLLKKRKGILLLFLLFPIVTTFINVNIDIPFINIINTSMGTNIILKEIGPLEICMYLLNIGIIAFLITDLFIRDIKYNLDNIFLRTNILTWFVNKVIIFLMFSFILKILQYSLVVIILLVNNKVFDNNVIYLMLTDYFYTSLIGFIFLLMYILFVILNKAKILPIIVGILLIIILPKSIWSLKCYIFYMIVILILIITIISKIIKNKNKKIFENL